MSLFRKILFSNDTLLTLFKKYVKHDNKKYLLDFFEKKKYNKFLKEDFFNYNDTTFYYYINTNYQVLYSVHLVDNISISYDMVINKPLNEILDNIDDKEYVEFIKSYFLNIKKEVEKSNSDNKNDIINSIDNLFTKKTTSFKDALQRILFINQLLWQTGHRLNGLGRLDKTLNDIYLKTNINKDLAYNLIKEFLLMLHNDYYYKSNALKGDTGQIIIIGGKNSDDTYFSNDLSYLFIKCVKDIKLPDPKTLLRVSSNMPDDLLKLGIESIKTGCGSPLLSNDEVVIKKLLDIGYTLDDASNYATSACWEPLADGMSFEQNNIADLNFLKPLNDILDLNNNYESFDLLLNDYLNKLKEEIKIIIDSINNEKIAYDPLMSSYIRNCNESKKDISLGSAKYMNYGVLTSGLGNTIDSLLNIKNLVFDKKKYKLDYLILEKNNNFSDDKILNELKNSELRYGIDNDLVIELTNKIIDFANQEFSSYKNNFGGVFRFGLSSPNYIANSKNIKASLDGRKDFEAYNVHISSTGNASYTEVINFASKLHYGIRNLNGNVCDLILTKNLLDNNFDKFILFIKQAIKEGFFQIQFNVLDSKTLIKAKENPEDFKDLIVRVWGFSAYFVELPEEYQDLLIERALRNENAM